MTAMAADRGYSYDHYLEEEQFRDILKVIELPARSSWKVQTWCRRFPPPAGIS